MRELALLTDSAEGTRTLGKRLASLLSGGEVVLLSGPLGAGKTTLAQGIGAGLGVKGRVQSPSFVLERLHSGRLIMRHLDFYRLTAAEVEDAGFFADVDDSAVTVVEWGERTPAVPGNSIRVRLSLVPGEPDRRKISIEAPSEWIDGMERVMREADSCFG